MLTRLNSENADRNLTSPVTVLTHTPDAVRARLCRLHVALGDGINDLDGTGGNFTLAISVGGQSLPAETHAIAASVVRAALQSQPFVVPVNAQVIAQVTSPNGADTNVDVTAFLYDAHDALARLALTGKRTHVVDTGVDQIIDEDGTTVVRTLTPSESGGTITVTPS